MSNFPRFAIIIASFLLFQCKQSSKPENTLEIQKKTVKDQVTSIKDDNAFLIKGTSFSLENTNIYLFKAEDDSFALVDSTTVSDAKFQFKGLAEVPSMYRVSEIRNKNKSFSILVDASEIHVFLNKRIDHSTSYSTSTVQKEYNDYTSQMTVFKDKGMALYYGLKGNFSAENIKKLKQDRLSLFAEQNSFIETYIKDHSNSYVAVFLVKENIRTYNPKTLRALYNGLSPDIRDLDFSKSIDSLIVEKESKIEKRLPVVVAHKVEENFTGEYRPKAYKISGLNPYGETVSLKSIPKGKVVLVDFWASWCGPCRATNPTLVALHKKYKSQGFEILSVSEDKAEAQWLNAIATDGLTWDYHVIDKNKSIAFRYGVESIPFKLLIDKNGNIASEKISGQALETRIQQLLKE
ncbi:thioredoxin-like domain-containing protein [uncultured Lacinutrix sp.]|uniref:thioredoxin-like domain-containing protein n=1 Tax=uncultured Lacinutrix sp. TaxID=574032 RepID=UPI00261C431E|nr:thioredoxin-like domain-containing protein [uncultured Lacinutrix sp.]